MLFDKTPEEILSEDERAKAQRQRDEQEARDRWQKDLEAGRRHREELRDVAKRFREKAQDGSPVGRAKAAMESGASVFQLTMPLVLGHADLSDPAVDHTPVLNAVEALGWRLTHASYVNGAAPPAPAADHADGAQPAALFGVYIFRRTI